MLITLKRRYNNFLCGLDERVLDMRMARFRYDYESGWWFKSPTRKEKIILAIAMRLPIWK